VEVKIEMEVGKDGWSWRWKKKITWRWRWKKEMRWRWRKVWRCCREREGKL